MPVTRGDISSGRDLSYYDRRSGKCVSWLAGRGNKLASDEPLPLNGSASDRALRKGKPSVLKGTSLRDFPLGCACLRWVVK
jgi:hypothetical protein